MSRRADRHWDLRRGDTGRSEASSSWLPPTRSWSRSSCSGGGCGDEARCHGLAREVTDTDARLWHPWPPRRAAHEVRAGDWPQDREGARPDGPALV